MKKHRAKLRKEIGIEALDDKIKYKKYTKNVKTRNIAKFTSLYDNEIYDMKKNRNTISIDLRPINKIKSTQEHIINPPMIFASKPRSEPDYRYFVSRSPNKNVLNDIREAIFTSNINKQQY